MFYLKHSTFCNTDTTKMKQNCQLSSLRTLLLKIQFACYLYIPCTKVA